MCGRFCGRRECAGEEMVWPGDMRVKVILREAVYRGYRYMRVRGVHAGTRVSSAEWVGWVKKRVEEKSAPGGIRTPNLLIRSQMLYPLSYGRR